MGEIWSPALFWRLSISDQLYLLSIAHKEVAECFLPTDVMS
jgi:hypothetical protein